MNWMELDGIIVNWIELYCNEWDRIGLSDLSNFSVKCPGITF